MCFKSVGRAFEGDTAVGAVVIAIAEESVEPEEQVKHIEGYDKEG